MKKILMFLLCCLTVIGLTTGCDSEKTEDNKEGNQVQEKDSKKETDKNQEKYSINETENGYEVVNSKDEVQFTTNEYSYLELCSNNKIIQATQGNYYIYLDLKGNRITEKNYWSMDSTIGKGTEFINGNVIVEDVESGKKGLLNENGTETIECKYSYMRYDEDEKLYLVDSNSFPKEGSAYYINEKDEKVKDW